MNVASTQYAAEYRAYVVSLIGTIAFAVLGVVAALWTGSRSVLMDGLFTLIGVPIAIVSMVVVRIADEAPTSDFPVGLTQARPLLGLFKALFMTGALILAMLESAQTMANGGRALPEIEIVIYAMVATAGCWLFAFLIATVTRNISSSLAQLEFHSWFKDGILSLSIGVVFAIGTWVDRPIVQDHAQYFDQGLVIAIGVSFLPGLVRKLVRNGRELLLGAPGRATRKAIRTLVGALIAQHPADLHDLTVIASGGRIFVAVDVTISSSELDLHWATELREAADRAVRERYPGAMCWLTFYPPR
ncbi:MAG: cation transporter [Spirochaetales bacterium]|nr:cation transporter [Spirochaetales bacterium]